MGDEMDTMIPEREMKVRCRPGPASFPPSVPAWLWRRAERGSAGAGRPASRRHDGGVQRPLPSSSPSVPEHPAVLPAQQPRRVRAPRPVLASCARHASHSSRFRGWGGLSTGPSCRCASSVACGGHRGTQPRTARTAKLRQSRSWERAPQGSDRDARSPIGQGGRNPGGFVCFKGLSSSLSPDFLYRVVQGRPTQNRGRLPTPEFIGVRGLSVSVLEIRLKSGSEREERGAGDPSDGCQSPHGWKGRKWREEFRRLNKSLKCS